MEEENWIDVKHQLPKDNQVVEVKGNFQFQPLCFFKRVRNTAMFATGKIPFCFQIFGITHWKSVDKSIEEVFEMVKPKKDENE